VELDQAEILAREAIVIVDVTDDVDLRAWLRIDLADVLSIAERTVEARGTLEEAVRLAEAKEDVDAAERARARLAELQASVPHR
jgi:hypothetical protein